MVGRVKCLRATTSSFLCPLHHIPMFKVYPSLTWELSHHRKGWVAGMISCSLLPALQLTVVNPLVAPYVVPIQAIHHCEI